MQVKKAIATQPKVSKLNLQVMNDLTVQIIPNNNFEFLMDSATVAKGYGVSFQNIASHKSNHRDELIYGQHFLPASAIEIFNSDPTTPHNKIFWTKAGVIRLGFFIKSERAKRFRDWAEHLVISELNRQQELFKRPAPVKKPVTNRLRHNRLTADRLLDILADVVKIEDEYLRVRITQKLMQ